MFSRSRSTLPFLPPDEQRRVALFKDLADRLLAEGDDIGATLIVEGIYQAYDRSLPQTTEIN